ncbi:MAG: enoyl-CoA hydratase/isomerase family protein [Planctomycetota bacterium]
MATAHDWIDIKVTDCAGTIILNRPEDANRMTRQMVEQLSEAFDDLYREKKVRAIIITGAGAAFSEGLDWHEARADEADPLTSQRWGEDAMAWRDLIVGMLEITKPIIASVNGAALSEGAGLVLASDIVVAADGASFGLPDPRYGLVAGIAAPLLSYRIGAGHAAKMLLSSSILDAEESMRLGVFHELVAHEKAWARALEIARECAAAAPEALQLTKRLLTETIGEELSTQLSSGAVMRATAFTTEAAREGLAAYAEDRRPMWK